MDDISEKLATILNDPDSMNRVRQMAESILGGEKSETKNEGNDLGITAGDMQTIMTLVSRFNSSADDDRTRLLIALKPHLSEPKREKVDTAVKILKMIELLPLLRESGFLNL